MALPWPVLVQAQNSPRPPLSLALLRPDLRQCRELTLPRSQALLGTSTLQPAVSLPSP